MNPNLQYCKNCDFGRHDVLNREKVGMINSKQKCYCFYRKNYELVVAIGEELWISGNRLENGKFAVTWILRVSARSVNGYIWLYCFYGNICEY